MLAPAVVHALQQAVAARIAYHAEQSEYRRALRYAVCPCNNDPFGNGPCEACRAKVTTP